MRRKPYKTTLAQRMRNHSKPKTDTKPVITLVAINGDRVRISVNGVEADLDINAIVDYEQLERIRVEKEIKRQLDEVEYIRCNPEKLQLSLVARHAAELKGKEYENVDNGMTFLGKDNSRVIIYDKPKLMSGDFYFGEIIHFYDNKSIRKYIDFYGALLMYNKIMSAFEDKTKKENKL